MKSSEIKSEKVWEGFLNNEPYSLTAIHKQDVVELVLEKITSGPLVEAKNGLLSFMKQHPVKTGIYAYYIADALRKYKELRDKSVSFSAKEPAEQAAYRKMMDEMKKIGYQIVSSGVRGSGYEWKMKK